MQWQFSPVWYKVWNWWWWHYVDFDTYYQVYWHSAGIGPLQFRWYSMKQKW